MNINHYIAFLKIAELSSLTRAAQELGYTQSAMTHIINRMEEEFGFSLFIRGRRGARLTDEGELIYPAIRAIVETDEQLHSLVVRIHGLESGTVRIATFSSVAVHWLPDMIKTFRQAHPHIDFKLLDGDYHDVETWLASGAVDLGFVTLPCTLDCETIPLIRDPLLAVIPKNHRLADAGAFPVEEFAHEDFISLLQSSDHDLRRTLEAAGVQPNIKFTTKDDYAIIAMVENGLGVSIMPQLLLRGHTENVRILPLVPEASRCIALAIPKNESASPAARSFGRHVTAWVGERYQKHPDLL